MRRLGFSGSAIGAPSSSSINSALGSAAAGPSALSSSEFARDHVIVSAPSGHGRLSAAGGSGTSGTAQQSVERTSLPGSQQQPLRKVHKRECIECMCSARTVPRAVIQANPLSYTARVCVCLLRHFRV